MAFIITSNKDKTIEERVISTVAKALGIAESDVKPDHKLEEDLGADSLDDIELILDIEDEFAIDISDEHAQPLKTVQQIIDFVKRALV